MNPRLTRLIFDYQESVRTAVVLMLRSGIKMPHSGWHWTRVDVPNSGELEGGVTYIKHGSGCEVELSTGSVDFDFGENGEISGFDSWKLFCFAKNRMIQYGFDSYGEIEECLSADQRAGTVIVDRSGLHYIADTPRLLAVDVHSRLPGDILPPRIHDPVLVLHAHYFQAAELMYENVEKLKIKWRKHGHLSHKSEIDYRIYTVSWLGFLAVTCEGFRRLRMRLLILENRPEAFHELVPTCDMIGSMMRAHSDLLRRFRNDVFHLRENTDVVRKFFEKEEDRVTWARELHHGIAKFFSEYRIQCEVHYFINGRKSEIEIGGSRRKRRAVAP